MKYTLAQVSVNKTLAKFHVQDERGDVIGSINVPPEDAAALLAHWSGAKAPTAKSIAPQQRVNAKPQLLPTAFARAAILRGC